MTAQELSLPGREGRTGYFLGVGVLLCSFFPDSSVFAVCPSSMGGTGEGTTVFLLGSFCFLGEQFQKDGAVPKAVWSREFLEKKKKKSFQLLCSLLPRVPFSSAGSNLAPTSSLNQSSSSGRLQIEVPHPGCTWSPTLDQSSWSHWGWVRGTHSLKSFQMILPCRRSQGAQVWGVCRLSESFLCSMTTACFWLESGGAGCWAHPA